MWGSTSYFFPTNWCHWSSALLEDAQFSNYVYKGHVCLTFQINVLFLKIVSQELCLPPVLISIVNFVDVLSLCVCMVFVLFCSLNYNIALQRVNLDEEAAGHSFTENWLTGFLTKHFSLFFRFNFNLYSDRKLLLSIVNTNHQKCLEDKWVFFKEQTYFHI